jgi:hypothetical protein
MMVFVSGKHFAGRTFEDKVHLVEVDNSAAKFDGAYEEASRSGQESAVGASIKFGNVALTNRLARLVFARVSYMARSRWSNLFLPSHHSL